MVNKIFHIITFVFLTACSTEFDVKRISKVYVQDFQSTEPNTCTVKDVDLSHQEAHQFFQLAKKVSRKEVHDHYDYAPCYIEGTLKYQDEICQWQIRAGMTGSITCKGKAHTFACDQCDAIFK